MKRNIRLFLCLCALVFAAAVSAQTMKYQDLYKVKKKDTIYGIAKKYNITIDQLISANPDMQKPDYTLHKGDQLVIPAPVTTTPQPVQSTQQPATPAVKKSSSAVRIGVMLPLHNVDGDGQRMVEYYRGILMACDSLKAHGISTDVKAWNVPIDANVQQTLTDNNAIKLVIPFSISGNDVASNDHIMQVYQSPQLQNELAVNAFVERFKGCHAVIVDCNDTTSRKGMFTSALRKRMEAAGIGYSITNLKSSEAMFAKAFDASKQNVVVLNTGRSPELNVTLAKLNGLKVTAPAMRISLFGYTEWLMYTKVYLEYYHRYDTYIPTSFYYNPLASRTANLERSYRRWFKSDMRLALPRFAITGYDHAQFFIRGLHKYGGKFTGTSQQSTYTPLQTPLKFKFVQGGGMQNSAFMLIHYKTNHTMESISY